MKNWLKSGDVITVAAPAAVSAGDGVKVGKLFGVAITDAASTAAVEIATKGVFRLAKVAAQAWTVGQAIYWDATDKVATTTTTTPNNFIGVAVAAAANPSSTGDVLLNGFAMQDPEVTSG